MTTNIPVWSTNEDENRSCDGINTSSIPKKSRLDDKLIVIHSHEASLSKVNMLTITM